MKYEIYGRFCTGEEWGEECHNLKELKFKLDDIHRNDCIISYKVLSHGVDITDKIRTKFYS